MQSIALSLTIPGEFQCGIVSVLNSRWLEGLKQLCSRFRWCQHIGIVPTGKRVNRPAMKVRTCLSRGGEEVNRLMVRSTMQVGDKNTQRHAAVDVALGFNLCPIIKREPFI